VRDKYELDTFLVGDFDDGARWMYRRGLEWIWGPLLPAGVRESMIDPHPWTI
jgi:hypothetical protein